MRASSLDSYSSRKLVKLLKVFKSKPDTDVPSAENSPTSKHPAEDTNEQFQKDVEREPEHSQGPETPPESMIKATSLDSYHSKKLAKLLKVFKSKSDAEVKSAESSPYMKRKTQPNQAPHRRFMRVVRDGEAQKPEVANENPHVIVKYTQEYLQQYYNKSKSFEQGKTLPYTTSGHTILKKSSTDPTCDSGHSGGDTSPVEKHATFVDVVKVIEFNNQEKVDDAPLMHEAKLHLEDGPGGLDCDEHAGELLAQGTSDVVGTGLPLSPITVEPVVEVEEPDEEESESKRQAAMRNIYSVLIPVPMDEDTLQSEIHYKPLVPS